MDQDKTLSYILSNYEFKDTQHVKSSVKSAYKSNDFNTSPLQESDFKKAPRFLKIEESDRNISKFWDITDKGKINVEMKNYFDYLEASGFGVYRSPNIPDDIQFVKVENMIVDKIGVKDIKDNVLSFVEKYAGDSIYNFFAKETKYFSANILNGLRELVISQVRDDFNNIKLFFQDFYYEVTAKDIKRRSYIDLNGRHLWRNTVISKDFKGFNKNWEKDSFFKFLKNSVGGSKEKLKAFYSSLGYNMHTFKRRSLAKLCYASDESLGEIDGQAEGGTGKTLAQNCLKHVRCVVTVDGRDYNPKNTFSLSRIDRDTQVVIFNEWNHDFTSLFGKITDDFEKENKSIDRVSIPFEESAKIMINSNITPSDDSSSVKRRLHLVQFGNYYSSERTPMDEFNTEFFSKHDWKQENWDCFFSGMLIIAQDYLKNGLVQVQVSETGRLKQLIQNSNEDFARVFESWYKKIGVNFISNCHDMLNEFDPELNPREFYTYLKKCLKIKGAQFAFKGVGQGKGVIITKK